MSNGVHEDDEELLTFSSDGEEVVDLEEELVYDYEGQSCSWAPEWSKALWRQGKRAFRVVIGLGNEESAYEALASEEEGDSDEPGSHRTEEAEAGFLSRMFFFWYNGMIDLSRKQRLDMKHVPKLLAHHEPDIHAQELEERWQEELERAEQGLDNSNASLVRAMYFAYRWEYLKAFFPRLIKVIGSFVGPWVIKLLVSFIENPQKRSIWWGLFLLVVLSGNLIFTSIALQQYWHIAMATSIHMKSGLTSLIYSKLLKLSAKSKQSNIAGKLTNLMSSDVSRLQDTVSYLHFLWATPLMMLICFVSVTIQVGIVPTLAGFAVFLGLAPISGFIAWQLEKVRAQNVVLTDRRVKATNEIFSTMKTVKVYALEEHFAESAQLARRLELASIRLFQVWKAMHSSINFTIVPLMTMATFWALISQGNSFAASTAFSIIAMYYVLKWPFNLLTQVISNIVESKVSTRRIEEFLFLEELPGLTPCDGSDGTPIGHLSITHGSFAWDTQSGMDPDLRDISLQCTPGTLTCVIGPVGSGKSSLLNVFLGEISPVAGPIGQLDFSKSKKGKNSFVKVRGSVCYAPQTPFLLHATVRDNITFGKPWDAQRYDAAVQVCALQADFNMLIAGDLTTIGERGINLSGGQKARIAMARAVYSDCDIVLLDDPLSAVDAHVGHQLFNDCIRTMLKHKTIILVTHQLQFVTHGDRLVVMQNGSISHQGSPSELKSQGVQIEQLLEKFNTLDGLQGDPIEEANIIPTEILTNGATMESSHTESTANGSHGATSSLSTDGSLLNNSMGGANAEQTLRTSTNSLRGSTNTLKRSLQLEVQAAKRIADQNEAATSKANMEQKEERATGRISMDVYKFYFRHMRWWWVLAVLLILCHRGVDVFLKVWIANWSSSNAKTASPTAPTAPAAPISSTSHFTHSGQATTYAWYELDSVFNTASFLANEGVEWLSYPLTSMLDANDALDALSANEATPGNSSKISKSAAKFLWVFIVGNLILAVLQLVKETMILLVTCATGRVVYMEMFRRLLRAPMAFFDTTPKGRIAARCSSDTDAMDSQLGGLLATVCDNLAQIMSSLVSIAMSVHWFVLGMIPMGLGYVNLYNRFINGYRELARLNGTTKAPLFSQFSETLNGLFTLRAYGAQQRFVEKLYLNLDANQRVYFFGVVSARWLGVRMDILGAFLISGIALVALFNRSVDPGLMGMALSYCLLNTELLNGLIRGISDIESRMNSVERIEQYTKIEVERAPIIEGRRPPKAWPSKGAIEFDSVRMRYREGLPMVLNGLTFRIRAGEKVGIVGRTGAGKSSLLTALLSLAPLESGRITIDQLDINLMGVDDLRSKLSIIPQDPCIFDGNVRHNIDPFGQHSDQEIWETLRRVHLSDAIQTLPFGLDSELADEGANFSLGQRQLLCVARAILRRSKILLLDEASSSIDLETDYLLQKTLRTEFADCTTITIAHRLATIMDSDRVMVLEAGILKEFDSPAALLANSNSIFHSLYEQAQTSSSH